MNYIKFDIFSEELKVQSCIIFLIRKIGNIPRKNNEIYKNWKSIRKPIIKMNGTFQHS